MKRTNRAVLLDFDGTLVDSEPLHHECWARAVRRYGGHVEWEDYARRFVGITDREAGHTLLSEAGHNPTQELINLVSESKHRAYRARCQEELTIDPKVCKWIHNQHGQRPVGVVSSSVSREVEPVLAKAGILSALDIVICGEHVSRHKPDPQPYLLALDLLNRNGARLRAKHCIVFEDSSAGITSAQRAGMRVRRVRSPSELLAALRDEVG